MGEKRTKIVFGAFIEDVKGLEGCPGEDGWDEWLVDVPGIEKVDRYGSAGIDGLRLLHPYESEPEWLGFLVQILYYGATWAVAEDLEGTEQARAAWEKLRGILREHRGIDLPEGGLIVAHDE